jgi:FkbM family methyltransferase
MLARRHSSAFVDDPGSRVPTWRETVTDLGQVYALLTDEPSRRRFLELTAFRILGHQRVKLWSNTELYWQRRRRVHELAVAQAPLGVPGHSAKLALYALDAIGYPVRFHGILANPLNTFDLEQYRYAEGGVRIEASPGDVVLDAGGCWGDTALYFAHKVGPRGRVDVFEFIPSNLGVLRRNLALNPELAERIHVVERPLWKRSGEGFYCVDRGPASTLGSTPSGDGDQRVESQSIDAHVHEAGLARVDLIKMDIEGAEPFALLGAVETLRRFRPKLAISIYHGDWHDFIEIPRFLAALGLGYRLYLDHFTIQRAETVLFATA